MENEIVISGIGITHQHVIPKLWLIFFNLEMKPLFPASESHNIILFQSCDWCRSTSHSFGIQKHIMEKQRVPYSGSQLPFTALESKKSTLKNRAFYNRVQNCQPQLWNTKNQH
jgi:hypothetical protein